jgi:hypothetical protein
MDWKSVHISIMFWEEFSCYWRVMTSGTFLSNKNFETHSEVKWCIAEVWRWYMPEDGLMRPKHVVKYIRNIDWIVFSQSSKNVVFRRIYYVDGSRNGADAIASGYGLDDWGIVVRVPVGSRIFFSPLRPDRLCGPLSLLSNEGRELFPWG